MHPAPNWMIRHYSLARLEALPTLSTGQSDDLKDDDGDGQRVWLSRCGVADGEPYPNKVTIETLEDGRWVDTYIFQAR